MAPSVCQRCDGWWQGVVAGHLHFADVVGEQLNRERYGLHHQRLRELKFPMEHGHHPNNRDL
jgi:hypothetical protein